MMSKPSESAMVRIVIVNDHFVMREGLRLILEGQSDFELVGASDGAAALRLVEEWQPHVVLMDLRPLNTDDLETIEHIRRRWPHVAVVILATHDDDELLLKGLHAGASGYLMKNVDRATLFQTIRAAARGETLLQAEVMARLLAHTILARRKNNLRGRPKCAGVIELTEREHDVLAGVARGERNKEIALRLGISETTVKTHLVSMYHKLEVDSRASAVVVAIERGWFSPPKRVPGH